MTRHLQEIDRRRDKVHIQEEEHNRRGTREGPETRTKRPRPKRPRPKTRTKRPRPERQDPRDKTQETDDTSSSREPRSWRSRRRHQLQPERPRGGCRSPRGHSPQEPTLALTPTNQSKSLYSTPSDGRHCVSTGIDHTSCQS